MQEICQSKSVRGVVDMGGAIMSEGQWIVLHTMSRQEKAVAVDLAAKGVPYFLPLCDRVKYYGKRKARVIEPLFPGYVFMRGEIEQAYEADRTRRVANMIRVPNQVGLTEELRNLELVLRSGVSLSSHPFLQTGMRVVVTSGPFKGVEGVVESMQQRRLILQIETLGQASSLEIDCSLLEPLEEVAAA
ncbi:transcription termination/antitermination protein NusG [Poriferisphaera sp. WC338]|uniref:transcription termination/antitermination protein NusG n=1 Tax=Poriferisphaera sp. WC338 TaxID=3425129 RepID=UPI003D815E9C